MNQFLKLVKLVDPSFRRQYNKAYGWKTTHYPHIYTLSSYFDPNLEPRTNRTLRFHRTRRFNFHGDMIFLETLRVSHIGIWDYVVLFVISVGSFFQLPCCQTP